ncbi:hypothetical protein CLV94_2072 [Flavobacterium endophyticum]|uniref:Uncharacterized protein n=1 Tax=Flavobacterium endophyticum TaxID=1540163 RepID=A0A495MAZ8_9FLAO|nr:MULTISPECIES: hypothetical protein [Flavobacterium]RKS23167.1 hypothetical protein CLV94_2072 [Flavobacterium endophyticum]WDO11875.1 hypothetical protein MH928_11095 [Flavobacterium sp. WW92]
MKKLFLLLLVSFFCFGGNAKTFEPLKITETSEAFFKGAQQRKKTVHVKSYKKKNGTTVKSHKRRSPRSH